MKHAIAQTRNGITVYVELVGSPAAVQIARQPSLLGLIRELAEQLSATTPTIDAERDMGRVIGYGNIVETTEQDMVLYARPLRDETYMRFVKRGKALATQYLSVLFRRDEQGSYEVYDVWLGRLHPPRPGGEDEAAESKAFWATHAFILDDQPIQLRTLTKECPY